MTKRLKQNYDFFTETEKTKHLNKHKQNNKK